MGTLCGSDTIPLLVLLVLLVLRQRRVGRE